MIDSPAHRIAEIIDGTLYTHPWPAMPHARASSSLGVKIGGPFDYDAGGPGGWWIIDEPERGLGEDILVPDLAGWRRERVPDYPRDCVRHPRTGLGMRGAVGLYDRLDLHGKRPVYAREGVAHHRLVDPRNGQDLRV